MCPGLQLPAAMFGYLPHLVALRISSSGCAVFFSLHPLTILRLGFFLISVNMPQGVRPWCCEFSLALSLHLRCCRSVTLYDIQLLHQRPRGAAALAILPEDSSYGVRSQVALTGRTMPIPVSPMPEGAEPRLSLNIIIVVGSSMARRCSPLTGINV